MGFKRDKIYKLVFEDPQFEGLIMRVKPISTGDSLDAAEQAAAMDENTDAADTKDRLVSLFGYIIESFVDWNYEYNDSDEIRPCTVETLLGMDNEMTTALVSAWLTAMVGVPDPLARRSTTGEEVGSIPMEVL